MLTQFVLCVVNVRFFSSAHELLLACVLAVFFCFLFFVHLCTCIISLSCKCGQHGGCLCLSGSLPLLSCMLVLIVF